MVGALALLVAAAEGGVYHSPFWQPLPAWDYWYLLLIPLSALISIVYKAVKCRDMKQVPREATVIFAMILLCMALAAVILLGLMRIMER